MRINNFKKNEDECYRCDNIINKRRNPNIDFIKNGKETIVENKDENKIISKKKN